MRKFIVISMATVALGFGVVKLYDLGHLNSLLVNLTWFQINKVSIQSKWPLSNQKVKELLPVLEGKNLLVVRPQPLMKRLEANKWVEAVVLKKHFPDHLSIQVEIKKPQAIYQKKGRAYFLDSRGEVIDKVTPRSLLIFDLPVISLADQHRNHHWQIVDGVRLLDRLGDILHQEWELSQIVLGEYPHFRIFLTSPKVEVLLSRQNWELQLPVLDDLLRNPPHQIDKIRRINLVLSKKAIVSSSISN